MKANSLALATVLVVGLVPAQVRAEVKPHPLFTDNAVLQQGKDIVVWGTAAADEKVTVTLSDETVTATNEGGKFTARLKARDSGGPHELTISGQNTVKVSNVLVGEVWVASGQSNMQWPVSASADPEKTVESSANERIRLFSVPLLARAQPQESVEAKWQLCGPDTVGDFSAVAYAFGKELEAHLKVPVGLINTSFGGTPAEAWTSRESLLANELLKKDYGDLAAEDNKSHAPSSLYNAMIHPLLPFAIRGAIWYQGESNASRAYQYRTLFPAMVEDWRKHWGQGDFPFLFVQLAPFTDILKEPADSAWAELREAQLMTTQNTKNTAMAVITDLGDEKDIHPTQKAPVGARLALAARAIAYGEAVEYSGPTFSQLEIQGDKAVLSFSHLGDGLVAKDGALTGFTIAGKDQKFVNAQAEIQGDKVVVSSAQVKEPVAVRYGWANYPVVNLWNKAGLPASPFRTDSFPGTTQPPTP